MTATRDQLSGATGSEAPAVAVPYGTTRLVLAAPDLVAPAFAGFSLVAMLLLVLGRYEPLLVLPLGAGGAAAAVYLARPRRSERDAGTDWRPVALLGVLVVAAGAVNVVFASEYIFAFRDPGTYGVMGRWLVDHPSVLIPYDNAMFGHVPGVDPGSLGFGVVHDRTAVFAQGNHLLPALLAVPGWLLSPDAVLFANPVIGALSLAPVYALARRLVGQWWGLVAPWALAASMPYLAFVRATYSEPVTMLLLIGGLALVVRAVGTGRYGDMAIAGLTLGSAALARVDSYAALLSVPVAAAFLCATAPAGQRRRRLGLAGVLLAGVALPVPIALYDLVALSPGYWVGRIPETRLLGYAALGLLAAGAVVVGLAWGTRLAAGVAARREVLGWVAAATIAAGFALLASRPLWYTARNATAEMIPNITAMQEGLQLPVDPTRTYDELSVSWLSWYFGWPTVVLGVLGLALLARRALRDNEPGTAIAVTAVLILSALYLTRVLIYPDQVWAMRRLMPVVVPGLLIGAAWSLSRLWGVPGRRGLTSRRVVAAGLAAVALAVPTLVSLRLSPVVEYGGQRDEVAAMCDALPADAVVLTVDHAGADAGYLQTIRAFCEVPTSSLADPSTQTLATMAAAAAERARTLHIVATDPRHVTWRTAPTPVSDRAITKWSETLQHPPRIAIRFERRLYVGAVGADGLVESIQPTP